MTILTSTDYPVHEMISKRWSPYAFDEKPVKANILCSLFEAARWAPSCFNEQPWHYIVATKDNVEDYQKLISCLVGGNQIWAKHAPVLALGVTKLYLERNNKPNRAAKHDLGLAAGNLLFEATARGLYVHQMIGILPERAHEIYKIPEGFEVLTGFAIGYRGTSANLPDNLQIRDAERRPRKPISEFVFSGDWGNVSSILKQP
jgi:nitroreductase